MTISTNDYSRLGNTTRAFIERSHGHFIDGQWTTAASSLTVIDPSSAQPFSAIGAGTEADIDAAVQAAHRAFHHSAWRDLAPLAREALLLKASTTACHWTSPGSMCSAPPASCVTWPAGHHASAVTPRKSPNALGLAPYAPGQRMQVGWAAQDCRALGG